MFLVKEHPDPGSKDPEEDYPKFGLLDQVCHGNKVSKVYAFLNHGKPATYAGVMLWELCLKPESCIVKIH